MGLWHFRFPPHLAQLRVAHEAEGPKQDGKSPSAHPTLRLTLERGARPSADALPNLSSVRPHTTEFALRSTLREVARREFKYLIMVATDPLDLMYLAQEARTYCPRVRLVTLGAHALYTHPELRRDFAGMLVGTSYPLLLENQAWYRAASSARLSVKSFTNESAQGIYNALQKLLVEQLGTTFEPLDFDVYPARGVKVPGPARWLTEVYNGRFWPLRVQGASQDRKLEVLQRSLVSPRSSSFLTGLNILWCALAVVHVLLLLAGSRLQQVPIVRLFARNVWTLPRSGQQYWVASHLVHAFSGSAIALVTQRVLRGAAPGNLLPQTTFVFTGILALIGLYVLLVTTAASLYKALGYARQRDPALQQGPRTRYGALVPVLVSVWMFAMVGIAIHALRGLHADLWGDRGRLLVTRLVDPLGMCGLWPILLLSAGLYLWGLFGLARVGAILQFARDTPFREPAAALPTPRLSDMNLLQSDANRKRIWGFELVAGLLCLFMTWVVSTTLLPSFEWRGFDTLLTATLCTLAAAVLFGALHGTILWNSLRHLLVRLAASPMVDAYDRIGTKIAGSFGLQLRSHVPNVDELQVSLGTLHLLASLAQRAPACEAIRKVGPELTTLVRKLAVKLGREASSMGTPVSDASKPDRARDVHDLFFEAACTLSQTLNELWRQRNEHMELDAFEGITTPDKLLPGDGLGEVPTAQLLANGGPVDLRLWTRAAEDFVAMRNATFVYHNIDQIRRCLGFALAGALALMFAVFSYPLHPPRFAATCGTLLLLCTVAAAGRVILGMEMNELLRRLARANHERSHFNANFWHQLVVYVLVPLLLLFSRAFPDVSDALGTILQPVWSILQ